MTVATIKRRDNDGAWQESGSVGTSEFTALVPCGLRHHDAIFASRAVYTCAALQIDLTLTTLQHCQRCVTAMQQQQFYLEQYWQSLWSS